MTVKSNNDDQVDDFEVPPISEQKRMVEALLFASSQPLTVHEIESRLPQGCDVVEVISLLHEQYETCGVHLTKIGDAWAFRTASDLGFLLQTERVEIRRLSRVATETLAIIAYHQPTTRAEIEEIRGVSVSKGTIDQLLELEWIRFGRRKLTPGRPVTFMVTRRFLDHFGLETVRDLPGLAELRAAGLLESKPLLGLTDDANQSSENNEITLSDSKFEDMIED
ncbi:MAG: SMC-Scp complex subunit ScpB [Aestuariivita sp.]|nr:SMC-Scp complex subunit ScpB [Aestuariivita sp.]